MKQIMEPLNSGNVDSKEEEHTAPQKHTLEKPNLEGDRLNFFLLILLYTVQGFSIGLHTSFSIILQSKNVTYEDQAVFSMAMWPFSIKLLFAPIVDAFYVQRIGRRKCWLILLQLLIGVVVLYLAYNVDDWIPEDGKSNVKMLVIVVFSIMFCTAIQDIVVDGWSLEILKKRNIGYSSICNSVGVSLGIFIGSVCFTWLVSEKFKNIFIQTSPGSGGIITMKNFLTCWAILIFTITALVGIFKKESRSLENDHEKINVLQNYILLWDILKLPRMRVLIIALLTSGTLTASLKTFPYLKLINEGIHKDELMFIKMLMFGTKLGLPIFLSKYAASRNSMSYFMKIMPAKFLFGIILTVFVYYTPNFIHKEGIVSVPMYYFLILSFVLITSDMLCFFLGTCMISFFSHISDPRFGGTYMTLLNTFFNLGKEIPVTCGLKLIGIFTYSKCSNEILNSCNTVVSKDVCKKNGGSCDVYLDGYFIIASVYIVFGLIWYIIYSNIFKSYQSLSLSHWIVYKQRLNTDVVMKLEEPTLCTSRDNNTEVLHSNYILNS